MKHLNNKGWGLGPFIILACIILCALLIVAALVIKMLGGKIDIDWNNVTGNVNYIELEEKVEQAGKTYQKKYYSDILTGDRFVVTLTRLKNENMFTEKTNCSGYVEIVREEDIVAYHGYIKCPNYQTKNYQERLDG